MVGCLADESGYLKNGDRARCIVESSMGHGDAAYTRFAKRGKIMQSSSQKFTVPQKFFCHFYTLAVVWTTFLLAATWFYVYKMAPLVSEPLQYSSSESSNTERHRHSVLLHVTNYFVKVMLMLLFKVEFCGFLGGWYYTDPSSFCGISSFYTAALLSLCCTFALETFVFASNRVVEFIVEGKNQIPAKEFDWRGFASPLMILRWYSWIGMAIFLWGWIHQCRCHAILLASDPGIRYFPFDGGNDFFIALLFFVKNLTLDRRGTCPIAAS
ncbi:hypothetical protein TEA_019828 [Camellia sinensis var. sinensis]|uniref:Uncharacterized protein n=1 Tax=Camellia sinensis var. sinensis TaxID=542762 RepID=A0A4S4E4B5_CAMSN|nr:hypothetical protein TEA_019828 [Camellia sinensis var. sinensis]